MFSSFRAIVISIFVPGVQRPCLISHNAKRRCIKVFLIVVLGENTVNREKLKKENFVIYSKMREIPFVVC